jgi:alpha-beta hydrolase superfamily lysophospholipase
MQTARQVVEWPGPSGTLVGTLHIPEGTIRSAVVLSHCFTCSRSLKATRRFGDALGRRGHAVLRYDFAGLGESEGEFAETTVTSNIADIEAAATYLASRNLGPIILAGHSLGGAATLLAAASVQNLHGVIAIASPFSADHVRGLFTEESVDAAFRDGTAEVNIGGRPFRISRDFFDDLVGHCTPERLAAIEQPLLVAHGTSDTIVPIDEGLRIFAGAGHPKWFAGIPDADHLFSTERAAERVGQAAAAFITTTGG